MHRTFTAKTHPHVQARHRAALAALRRRTGKDIVEIQLTAEEMLPFHRMILVKMSPLLVESQRQQWRARMRLETGQLSPRYARRGSR